MDKRKERSIYHLSWNEDSFLAKFRLFKQSIRREKEKMQSGDPMVQAQGYSALSSTYYSIFGTAGAQCKKFPQVLWFLFTWLPLAVWCYLEMLPLSNKVVELIGYEGMTAEMCDIRQSILRRCSRLEEAYGCIDFGLTKETEKMHTYGLLLVGLADIRMRKGDWRAAEIHVDTALKFARESEKTDPRQATRIYRKCADITGWLEKSNSAPDARLRRKAKELARETGAKDQLLKI